jgi:hypothetical protein
MKFDSFWTIILKPSRTASTDCLRFMGHVHAAMTTLGSLTASQRPCQGVVRLDFFKTLSWLAVLFMEIER